jgi:hypothetical protein
MQEGFQRINGVAETKLCDGTLGSDDFELTEHIGHGETSWMLYTARGARFCFSGFVDWPFYVWNVRVKEDGAGSVWIGIESLEASTVHGRRL